MIWWAVAGVVVGLTGGILWWVVPRIRGYRELCDRARVFSKSVEVLKNEKRTLLENLDEGVITIDGGGRISYSNLKAELLLGVVSDQLLGKVFLDLAIGDEKSLFRESQKLVSRGYERGDRVNGSFILSEKEKIHLEIVMIPSGIGKGAVLLMQDRSNQQKVLDMGKEFIANASHELRTPITIIRGFAETLHDLKEVSDVMYESILEKIIRNCERMEMLVKNLLLISDLDNMSKAKMHACDLMAVLDESCNQCITAFPNVSIERLTNVDSFAIWGDEGLLELAIFNILKNAVRYSAPPAKIVITVKGSKSEVTLSIQDKGIGIPSEDLERIFDRFFTVDKAHTRKLGGAGLGLSIVKMIVEKHDGKVWATSKLGEGATFHLRFNRV